MKGLVQGASAAVLALALLETDVEPMAEMKLLKEVALKVVFEMGP